MFIIIITVRVTCAEGKFGKILRSHKILVKGSCAKRSKSEEIFFSKFAHTKILTKSYSAAAAESSFYPSIFLLFVDIA